MKRVSLSPCPVKVAVKFNSENHRRLPAILGGMWAVAAIIDGETVGVAIVGHPQARMSATRLDELEVLRVAVIDGAKNACSALYAGCARAARAMGAGDLSTTIHIDEAGVSLLAAGWTCIGETVGGEWSRPSRPRKAVYDPRPKVRWAVPWGRLARLKAGALARSPTQLLRSL
jgi:hypothetical protein